MEIRITDDKACFKVYINASGFSQNSSLLEGANEKYIYLDNSLPTNSSKPKYINAGDVMLYGNNCLVIFYQSFDTTYSYTKIGHIDDLANLGNDNIHVIFEK